MSRFKMALMAMVAVFAIGAVGASAAQAGTGSITIQTTNYGTASCDFTFAEGSWDSTTPPANKSISGIQADNSTGKACTVNSISGSGTVTKASASAASFGGSITLNTTIPVIGTITCTYNPVNLAGTWTSSGANNVFTLGSPWTATWDSGTDWLCPGGYAGGSITSVTGSVTTAA